jgi:hypothetical protein
MAKIKKYFDKEMKRQTVSSMANVAALIQMGKGNTAIGHAVRTCAIAGIKKLIIKDDARSAKDYEQIPELAAFSAGKGVTVTYLKRDQTVIDVLDNRTTVLLEIPPDLFATRAETHTVLSAAQKSGRNPRGYRRFATAPTFDLKSHWTNGFILLFHVFFSLVSLFVGFRIHRNTYLRATVLVHEADFTRFPEEPSRAAEKEPFGYGAVDVRFTPPSDRKGMANFLYIAYHETMTLRRWMLLLIYCFFLSFPLWDMRLGWPFSSATSIQSAFLAIFTPLRIMGWSVHLLLSLYYINAYFNDLAYWHAFLLPFYSILLPIVLLYAKVGWTGVNGPLPKLSVAHLLPSFSATPFSELANPEEEEEEEEENSGGDEQKKAPVNKQQRVYEDESNPGFTTKEVVAHLEEQEDVEEKLARLQREMASLLKKARGASLFKETRGAKQQQGVSRSPISKDIDQE